jgi:soluble lytic murein transglycosylase
MSVQLSPLIAQRPATRALSGAGRLGRVLLALLLLVTFYAAWRQRQATRRTHAYDRLIREAAARHQVPPSLVKGVIQQESRFRPWVTGAADEMGLMQITDGAVRDWERVTGQRAPARGMLYDPRLNIEIGTWYLAAALRRWQAHPDAEVLALAQYNAGIRHALKWASPDPAEPSLERIRFPGTRQYIVQVLKYRDRYRDERFDEP